MYSVTPYTPVNFWTPLGAALKMEQLRRKGFPNVRNWRFVTLTIKRERFATPLEAYEAGKRQIRQMIYEVRKRFTLPRYCWKLEIHPTPDKNGEFWPHWHMLWDYKRPIPAEIVHACWRLGRVDVRGVTDSRFDYLFKYVAKAVDNLPDWIAGLVRPRCWQTSRGFFDRPSANHASGESAEKASPRQAAADRRSDTQNETVSLHRETLGERMKRWSTSCVVRSLSRQANGRPFYRVVELERDWGHACATFAKSLLRNPDSHEGNTLTQNNIKTSWLTKLPFKNPLQIMMSFPASSFAG